MDSGPLLVGVFVNSPLEEVRSILEIAQIDLAQLHGDEPVSVVEQLHGRGFKALRPRRKQKPRSMRVVRAVRAECAGVVG